MGRRFEDRYTAGGVDGRGPARPLAVRQSADGTWSPVPGETRDGPPVLPPVHGARAAALHEPLNIMHSHQHPDGHGRTHAHAHIHRGDAAHTGDGHAHAGIPAPDGGAVMPAAPGMNSAELTGAIRGYLAGQGIDPDEALAGAGRQREYAAERASGSRQRIRDRVTGVALNLRAARRALAIEQDGWLARRPGCSIGQVNEARSRVTALEAEWRAVTCNDEALQSAVWAAIR
ncbi:MAG TPA: hypothetical protein VFQ68_16410 [Streptosporangiaceae bacterium]|nr:hypothetical protein [Streptosporangiaceae bacterium]